MKSTNKDTFSIQHETNSNVISFAEAFALLANGASKRKAKSIARRTAAAKK